MGDSLEGIGSVSFSSIGQGLLDAGRFAVATNGRVAAVALLGIAALAYTLGRSHAVVERSNRIGNAVATSLYSGVGATRENLQRFAGSTAAEIKATLRGELVLPPSPKAKKGEDEAALNAAHGTQVQSLTDACDARAFAINRALTVSKVSSFVFRMLLASPVVVIPTLLFLRK